MKPFASKQRRRGMGRGYEGETGGMRRENGKRREVRARRVVYVKNKVYR
jgi:hypothetical protein